jgi:hypothetical protein
VTYRSLILLVNRVPEVASVEDRACQIGCSVLVESPEGVLEKKVEQA